MTTAVADVAASYARSLARIAADRDVLAARAAAQTSSRADDRRRDILDDLLRTVPRVELTRNRMRVVEAHRQFLEYNPDDGGVVEVVGDLTTAARVAVIVPGVGRCIENSGTLHDRALVVAEACGPGTAVMTYGYRRPQRIEALTDWHAVRGARRLRRLLTWMQLQPAAGVTAIGHSIGGVVVGQALRREARIDRAVLLGAPGLGGGVRSATDLGGAQVFAARAPGDVVPYSRYFGPDPVDLRGVTRLQTGMLPASTSSHVRYFDPASELMRNIARVVRGDLGQVTAPSISTMRETGLLFVGASRDARQAVLQRFRRDGQVTPPHPAGADHGGPSR